MGTHSLPMFSPTRSMQHPCALLPAASSPPGNNNILQALGSWLAAGPRSLHAAMDVAPTTSCFSFPLQPASLGQLSMCQPISARQGQKPSCKRQTVRLARHVVCAAEKPVRQNCQVFGASLQTVALCRRHSPGGGGSFVKRASAIGYGAQSTLRSSCRVATSSE
ncbi:hypothetical protein MN608_06832 [Microdochium nivale]|nr:hypothetical protein MN608_06832 [Microdochium nivale]